VDLSREELPRRKEHDALFYLDWIAIRIRVGGHLERSV